MRVVEVIPFKNFKEKIKLVKELKLRKGRISVFENYIVSEYMGLTLTRVVFKWQEAQLALALYGININKSCI